ncbi:MAG TPA: hypothetical protein VFB22_10645 [Candidatus Baltobacteraceae bacterium]|nr:hypothetical protein [Candidatus Baltobacteraceae bacterium]
MEPHAFRRSARGRPGAGEAQEAFVIPRVVVAAPPRTHWIPPGGLLAGQLSLGFAWLMLIALGTRHGGALAPLAWVHLVALGGVTTIALSVLIHVVPAFTDATWRRERMARVAIAPFWIGAVALSAGFWFDATGVVAWAARLAVIALVFYFVPALITLRTAIPAGGTEAAVARALGGTLLALAVTAALGLAMSLALGGMLPPAVLNGTPPIHAAFGVLGWLTLLVMGVSARTLRPIAGVRTRSPLLHVFGGSAVLVGTLLLAAGFAFAVAGIVASGFVLCSAGAGAYVFDVADVLGRATVPHRPPQAFVGAALLWLCTGVVLAAGALRGAPTGAAAIYVLLAGWVGQMVNAHLYHIGIRLVSTMARGEDDETRPAELLSLPLTWATFAAFQLAVALGVAGILAHDDALVAAAGACGFAAWLAMCANVLLARQRAALPPPATLISLLG